MMKSTVRAHFFNGEHGIIALTRKLHFLDGFGTRSNSASKFQLEGCGNLKRSLHCSIDEDDDFSELGAPMNSYAGHKLKLLTEKPEFHRKSKPKKKDAPASSFPKEIQNIVKDISIQMGSSPAERSGSGFGKISNAFTRMTSDRDASQEIKAKAVEETVTIKILHISSNTADSTIHSVCSSYGHFGGFVRKKDTVVEASFTLKHPLDAQSLITKLNYTTVDGCRWSASVDTKDSDSMVMTHHNKSESKYLEQFSEYCDKVREQIMTRKICLEDLENLHQAIYHLECQPVTSIEVPNI